VNAVAATAAFAALATALAFPPRPSTPRGPVTSRHRGGGTTSLARTPTTPVVVVSVVVAAALVVDVPLLLIPTTALLTWAGLTALARSRRDAQSLARRTAVVDACEAMLGELVAGQPPTQALARAGEAWPELAPAAGAARLGADVPAALRALAVRPGAGALERLAGAWQLCAGTGSGLAAALEQVVATLRAEHEVVLAVRAELAAARATARLLAVLPLVVLVAAHGIGGSPWQFLLATVPGQICLGVGVTLGVAGVTWLERIADDAQGETR
jgi:tight adherence protein B